MENEELLTKPKNDITLGDFAILKKWYEREFGIPYPEKCICSVETLRKSLKKKLGYEG